MVNLVILGENFKSFSYAYVNGFVEWVLYFSYLPPGSTICTLNSRSVRF